MTQTTHASPPDLARTGEPTGPGLEGVIAAETRLSMVDGQTGRLVLAGYPVEQLAGHVSWEAVLHLLWWDRLPTDHEQDALRREMAASSTLNDAQLAAVGAAARTHDRPIDSLIQASAAIAPPPTRQAQGGEDEGEATWHHAVRIAATLPVALAAVRQARVGAAVPARRDDLGVAANLLWQLRGQEPSAAEARALELYLVAVSDHGLNASTFTARVIASTGAELGAAVTGAIGALSGWRHGGAPGPVLDMLDEIGTAENAGPWLQRRLAAGERVMGFGHRVYRVRDPRAALLQDAVQTLLADDSLTPGVRERVKLATAIEEEALAALRQAKPGRALHTNVEFYTAILLEALGLERDLFTCVFAVGRTAGWLAHAREAAAGRLIRPRSRYVGQERGGVPQAR